MVQFMAVKIKALVSSRERERDVGVIYISENESFGQFQAKAKMEKYQNLRKSPDGLKLSLIQIWVCIMIRQFLSFVLSIKQEQTY